MDVSSQGKFIQDSNILAARQDLSKLNQEMNSMHTGDEKVLKKHVNVENHKSKSEMLNGSPSREQDDHTGTNSSRRKIVSKFEHQTEEIQPLVCSSIVQFEAAPEVKTNNLSQPGKRKRGRPRKAAIVFTETPRVLRSKSQVEPKVSELVNAPTQDAESSKEKKRRKTMKIKTNQNNEFSKIKTHLRYLLNRMNYEQNFIEAYAGEGWKGQSLEKIKPEKELERARSDINRYKLKLRDLFQRIDRSSEEGRIPESLYDSEGLIDSEDIFCAKCGQKEVRLDNDIILCDGVCERGFHQYCLDPPLLKDQVPPGDEGWLCPACDCKVDCIELLNDSQGTDLSISDGWEKVFPETAASGNKLDDISGLPSDDSGDDDYNPDGPEVEEEVDGEESSSDESDFSSASEDLAAVVQNEQYSGLPSEDSEDDDFNPDRVASDEQAKTESSSSDFTSDSEDLDDVYKNEGTSAEVQGQVMSEDGEDIPKTNTENVDSGPITAKRHVERLDYKKLHDETYGNVSSDSSDEDFLDIEEPRRQKNNKGTKDMEFNQTESTPARRTSKKLDIEGTSSSRARKGSSAEASDKSGTKSANRRLGEAATQRLYETFKENQYPDHNVRENLAKELNITYNQVRKWFENARWSFNHPEKRTKTVKAAPEPSTSMAAENCKTVEKKRRAGRPITNQRNEASATPSNSIKGKTKSDHIEITPSLKGASSIDSSNQNARRSDRVQAKRL